MDQHSGDEPVGIHQLVAVAWAAYVAALRHAGEPDLADLIEHLNPRTYSGEDAEPGARTPRYVVDLHGASVDVWVNQDGQVVVDVGGETPEGRTGLQISRRYEVVYDAQS